METNPIIHKEKEIAGYRLIFGYVGLFLIFIGAINLLPLVMIPFDVQNNLPYLWNFLITGLSCSGVGCLLYFLLIFKRKLGRLQKYQDAVLILLIWLFSIVVSAIPLATSKLENMNYVNALFEMVSGFTTAGVSTIANVEVLPKIFLLHRVISQLFGGIGLVLVITTAFSGKHGMKLYNAEGHSESFLPNLAKSARIIIILYLTYVAVGTGAFMIAGMNFFEAFSYSAACISTGGFCVTNAGIYGYQSLAVEIIAMVLMIIGATNFFVHLFLVRGKFKKAYKDSETLIFLGGIAIIPLLCALLLTPQISIQYFAGDEYARLGATITHFGDAFRYSIFHVIAAMTTTGFSNVESLSALPEGFIAIICILMIIGGSSGSTAGGIKIYRIHLFAKGIYFGLKESFNSNRVISTHFVRRYGDDQEITRKDFTSATGYGFMYLFTMIIGMILISIGNPQYPFGDIFFETASLTGGAGMSILTGPLSNGFTLWVGMILMLLGRLEIIVVFNGIAKGGNDIVNGFKEIHHRRKEKALDGLCE